MTYCVENFRTKTQLKHAISDGRAVSVFEPALGSVPTDGVVYLEGPHFPEMHAWYAVAILKNGKIVSVK
jgi:hypothetical protein